MSPEDIKNLTETVASSIGTQPINWLPLLLAALLGSLVAFLPTFVLECYRDHKFSKRILIALLAEISALIEIAERRKYQESIREVISYLATQPEGTAYTFTVKVPDHYSRIFQSNCENIGAIKKEYAKKIIQFHQLVDAVVQDIKPGGIVSNGATIEVFKELDEIFTQALQVGSELAAKKV